MTEGTRWGIGTGLTVLGLVLAALAIIVPSFNDAQKRREEQGRKPGNLVPPAPRAPLPGEPEPSQQGVPYGPNLPTPLNFLNDGENEVLMTEVIFSKGKWVDAPQRRNIISGLKPVRITLKSRHYDPKKNEYRVRLRPAASVPHGEWRTLEVALVDPSRVGKTFICTATIIYDGAKQRHYKKVELDALKQAPEKTPED